MRFYVAQPSFQIGPLTLYWYGLILTLAIFVVYLIAFRRANKAGVLASHIENIFLLAVPSGIIGARLYHVIESWSYYQDNFWQVFNVRAGGIAIHGAMLGGLFAIWGYTRFHKLSALSILDLAAPAFAIGQAIGRWGNFLNQELYGLPTALPWKIYIEPYNRLPEYFNESFYHPTFLYESLLSLLSAVILFRVSKRIGLKKPGLLFGLYLFNYGWIRFLTESIRIDEQAILGPIKLAQLMSVALIVAGTYLIRRQVVFRVAASRPQKQETTVIK